MISIKQLTKTNTYIWYTNCALFGIYLFATFGGVFLKSSVLEYSYITPDPFDGTTYPIDYVPDWTKSKNTNKSLLFQDIDVNEFIPLPKYDITALEETKNSLLRYEYPVVYLGSYRLNYAENDGSHCGVDIRAPIGTPVNAIANGVVIKTQTNDASDGKYVVIKHTDVPYNGSLVTVYSSYLHLQDALVEEGQKVSRGSVIGRVGMTGITTTPHLHLQLDTIDSPFHPYWPYTTKEASQAGLDFFGAINAGLGKENAIKYTLHPLQFIQSLKSSANDSRDISIQTDTTTGERDVTISSETNTGDTTIPAENTSNTASSTTSTTSPAPITTETHSVSISSSQETIDTTTNTRAFSDVSNDAIYATFLKKLATSNIIATTQSFHPDMLMPRKDAIVILGKYYKTDISQRKKSSFSDLDTSNISASYADKFVELGIIRDGNTFRPNDAITRGELITMIVRLSKITLPDTNQIFSDVGNDSPFYMYVQTYAQKARISGKTFGPTTALTKANMLAFMQRFVD